MADPDLDRTAEAVQRFSRFYMRHTGALHERLHKSRFSLAEMRVLHELAHVGTLTAAAIARNLRLDTGYLSRMLTRFERQGLVTRQANEADARTNLLALTREGYAELDAIDIHRKPEISASLESLTPAERSQLVTSMADVERLLSPASGESITRMRRSRCGDFGWIVERHAQFASPGHAHPAYETYAANVVARYLNAVETTRQRFACWVVEQADAARVGAALLTAQSDTQARIDVLFVEPGARRRGLGAQLVTACTRFAFGAGYESLVCCFDSTHADLHGLFARAGFDASGTAPEGTVWRLDLRSYIR
jgi:DNA-binding MarR family transcriptional regulator/N-acetylglutamate synthase-like GNAT family acetyltransferase